MPQKISLTLGQYLLMSETHIKNLVAQGFEVVIENNATQPKVEKQIVVQPKPTTSKEVKKPASIEAKPTKPASSKKKSNAKSAKADKKSSSKGSTTKDKIFDKSKLGKVLVGNYFACYNLANKNNPVLAKVGYAKEVRNDTIIVYDKGTEKHMFAIENCLPISKATYGQLVKKNKKLSCSVKVRENIDKDGKFTRLPTKEYTQVLAFIAKKTKPEVDYVELTKGELTENELKEVRDQIHKDLPELKLTATEAVNVYYNEVVKA